MIIKIEMAVDFTDDAVEFYKGSSRKPYQIVLDEIKSAIEYDGMIKVVTAEAYETNHIK